jgi:hypothetical protein
MITDPAASPIGVPLTGVPTAKPHVLFVPRVDKKLDPEVDASIVTIGATPKVNWFGPDFTTFTPDQPLSTNCAWTVEATLL